MYEIYLISIVNEVAPTELKGPLGAVTQILITVGIMISFFLGIPVPDFVWVPTLDGDRLLPKDGGSFESDNYWRLLFSLPIAFSLFQSIMLMTVFNYETPKFLKQTNQHAQLNKLMGNIYESDRIKERIDAIVVETGKQQSPSYSETLCHPKYAYATFLGCALSVLQ